MEDGKCMESGSRGAGEGKGDSQGGRRWGK